MEAVRVKPEVAENLQLVQPRHQTTGLFEQVEVEVDHPVEVMLEVEVELVVETLVEVEVEVVVETLLPVLEVEQVEL